MTSSAGYPWYCRPSGRETCRAVERDGNGGLLMPALRPVAANDGPCAERLLGAAVGFARISTLLPPQGFADLRRRSGSIAAICSIALRCCPHRRPLRPAPTCASRVCRVLTPARSARRSTATPPCFIWCLQLSSRSRVSRYRRLLGHEWRAVAACAGRLSRGSCLPTATRRNRQITYRLRALPRPVSPADREFRALPNSTSGLGRPPRRRAAASEMGMACRRGILARPGTAGGWTFGVPSLAPQLHKGRSPDAQAPGDRCSAAAWLAAVSGS
jgi:hypothetical protein